MYGSGSLILYEVFILTYPMFTGFITLIYVISMKFLSLRRRCSSWQNVPSSEEQGERALFPGYTFKRYLQKIGLYLVLCSKSRDVSCILWEESDSPMENDRVLGSQKHKKCPLKVPKPLPYGRGSNPEMYLTIS